MKKIEEEIEVLKINSQLLSTDLKKIETTIKDYFADFKLKPTHRLIFNFSDYPDIISHPFEHRDYTESCDDMESYFRANLFHLINQNKKLIWSYQSANELNKHNAFLFVFYKPLFILAERISYSIEISRSEAYKTLAEYFIVLGLIKHYLHAANYPEQSKDNNFDELTTVMAVYLIPSFYLCEDNLSKLIHNLQSKLFRRSLHTLFFQKQKNEIMSAFIEMTASPDLNLKNLLLKLEIQENNLL